MTHHLAFTACLASSLTLSLACTAVDELPDVAKLTANRTPVTLAYSANLWAELTECG